jgi:hypothetical protein
MVKPVRNVAVEILLLMALFGVCCGSGLIWGLLVKAPTYPRMGSIALYPGAQGVAYRVERPVGMASPLPVGSQDRPPGVNDFQFHTSDSPNIVLAFYEGSLVKMYGFQVWRIDSPAANSTAMRFVRETDIRVVGNKGGYDKEFVTVAITSTDRTNVEVDFQVQPFVP